MLNILFFIYFFSFLAAACGWSSSRHPLAYAVLSFSVHRICPAQHTERIFASFLLDISHRFFCQLSKPLSIQILINGRHNSRLLCAYVCVLCLYCDHWTGQCNGYIPQVLSASICISCCSHCIAFEMNCTSLHARARVSFPPSVCRMRIP